MTWVKGAIFLMKLAGATIPGALLALLLIGVPLGVVADDDAIGPVLNQHTTQFLWTFSGVELLLVFIWNYLTGNITTQDLKRYAAFIAKSVAFGATGALCALFLFVMSAIIFEDYKKTSISLDLLSTEFFWVFAGCEGALAVFLIHFAANKNKPEHSSPVSQLIAARIFLFVVIVFWVFSAVQGLTDITQNCISWIKNNELNWLFFALSILGAYFGCNWSEGRDIALEYMLGVERVIKRPIMVIVGMFESLNNYPRLLHFSVLFLVLLIINFTISYPIVDSMKADAAGFVSSNIQLSKFATNLLIFKACVLLVIAVVMARMIANEQWAALFRRNKLDNCEFDSKKKATELLIAHLSDIHCPRPGLPLTEERQWDPSEFQKLMNKLNSMASKYDLILISGDITDTGDNRAWSHFLKSCGKELMERLAILPGNHDINIVGWGIPGLLWWSDAKFHAGRERRTHRFFSIFNYLTGTKGVVWNDHNESIQSLSNFFEERRAWIFLSNSTKGPLYGYVDMLSDAFPVAIPLNKGGVYIMLWNSVKPSSVALFNAVGEISSSQIARGEKLCKALCAQKKENLTFLHATHHQVALPRELHYSKKRSIGQKIKDQWQAAGMMVESWSIFIGYLRDRRRKTVLFHGHHHKCFFGTIAGEGIQVVSASSSMLGFEGAWPKSLLNSGSGWSEILIGVDNQGATVQNITWVTA